MGCQEENLTQRVSEIYEKLAKLEDLSPSKQVNSLFTELVHLCIPKCEVDITKLSKRVREIRAKLIKLSGIAEGLLESHFSAIIGSNENPIHSIKLFPYYSNYLKLSQLEFSLLSKNCSQNPNRIAFVGSGPLPLSSIILATSHFQTTSFHNYDLDQSANSQAIKLVSSDPDLSKRMFFHTANIMDVSSSLKDYDIVFLAALVAMEKEEKVKVIEHLSEHMAPGATLLVRSAHGARVFLYPVIDPCDLQGFEVLTVFHPTDEVINSLIIARKTTRPVLSVKEFGSALLFGKCSDIQGFDSTTCKVEELIVSEHQS